MRLCISPSTIPASIFGALPGSRRTVRTARSAVARPAIGSTSSTASYSRTPSAGSKARYRRRYRLVSSSAVSSYISSLSTVPATLNSNVDGDSRGPPLSQRKSPVIPGSPTATRRSQSHSSSQSSVGEQSNRSVATISYRSSPLSLTTVRSASSSRAISPPAVAWPRKPIRTDGASTRGDDALQSRGALV